MAVGRHVWEGIGPQDVRDPTAIRRLFDGLLAANGDKIAVPLASHTTPGREVHFKLKSNADLFSVGVYAKRVELAFHLKIDVNAAREALAKASSGAAAIDTTILRVITDDEALEGCEADTPDMVAMSRALVYHIVNEWLGSAAAQRVSVRRIELRADR